MPLVVTSRPGPRFSHAILNRQLSAPWERLSADDCFASSGWLLWKQTAHRALSLLEENSVNNAFYS